MEPVSAHEFEVFISRLAPTTSEPSVTVQKRGMLSINSAVHAMLGFPTAVELMYDTRRRMIGMRAAPGNAYHAYPLRRVTGRSSGPFLISGTAFLKYFGITMDVTRRWTAHAHDGLVWINLNEEGVPVTSNRAAEGRAGAAPND